ncbi:MAG: hypothetical protein KDA63_20705 [Planctomycetales bacterium]|nr:hypothetical protein [Planctomycetales bacterium]
MACECGSQCGGSVIQQLDLETLSSLKAFASESAPRGCETQRVWMIGEQPTIANGAADGKRGCVTIPYLGIPIKLCWEIKEADLIPPEVSVRTRITIAVAEVEYLSATMVVKCNDIAQPSTCSMSVEDDHVLKSILKPSCNWGCLAKCAPGCISCGTDYWCWAGCAATCALKCCKLF